MMRTTGLQSSVVILIAVATACGGTESGSNDNQFGAAATTPVAAPGTAAGTPGAATPGVVTPTPGVPSAGTPMVNTPVNTPETSTPVMPGASEPAMVAPAPVSTDTPPPGEPAPVAPPPAPDTTTPGTAPMDTAPVEPVAPEPSTMVDCGLTIDSQDVSSEIPTVGIISWSATGNIDEASIEFGPTGGELSMSAPVDLTQPGYRTLLLGMKGSSDYDFQIVASSGGQSCVSEVSTLSTGPVANSVPVIDRDISDEAAIDSGFIVTLGYAQNAPAFIFDKDGDPVWWGPAPANASAARLSWDSQYVYTVTGNPNAGGQGAVMRISVDGSEQQTIQGTDDAHHDLAPLPDGNVAVLMHGSNCSEVAEITPEMTVTTTIDLATAYGGGGCHANSILYHPADDTFTISDRSHNLYVKVTRAGELLWQFGGSNPLGPHIEGSWNVNHGHHVLDNGHFLFFNNNGMGGMGGGGSPVHEFALDEQSLSAELLFSYTSASGESSSSLGDVQRLGNGNTLITYSNQGVIHEVNEAGELVQVIKSQGALGYAMHRVSLYGAPPK